MIQSVSGISIPDIVLVVVLVLVLVLDPGFVFEGEDDDENEDKKGRKGFPDTPPKEFRIS